MEQQQRQRDNQQRQRRGSITEPVPATFDWHHSIRIAGTPPPSYVEAKKLPTFDDAIEAGEKQDHKGMVSKETEEEAETKVDSKEEEGFVIVNGSHPSVGASAGATAGQNVNVIVNGSASRSHDQSSGNATVQIDIENHPGDETRTFSTQYTEYVSASS